MREMPDVSGYVVICPYKSDKTDKGVYVMTEYEIPEMPVYFGKNTYLSVHLAYLPQIGYFLTYQDKDYEILEVTTYQEKVDKGVIVTHVLKCLEVDENGEDVGNDMLILKVSENSDKYGISVP